MLSKKIDPYTLEEFVPRRKNQRFASEKNKADFHNELARQEREIRKEIDAKIIKNHRILKTLLGDAVELKTTREKLIALGFDFIVFNHFKLKVINGVKYQFLGVYQFLYAYLDDKSSQILILKMQ